MKFITLIATVSLLLVNQASGQKTCIEFESTSDQYWPLTTGIEKEFFLIRDSKTTIILEDSIELGNKFYRIRKETFMRDGRTAELYFREENSAIYRYDIDVETESLVLPANPEVGMKWTTASGWNYEVLSLNSSLSTHFCDFSNLLELVVANGICTFHYFYKKGNGLVGITENGRINSHIQGEKKAGYQVYKTTGCEGLIYEMEIRECTYRYVYEYLMDQFDLPKKKIVPGKITINATIEENGEISFPTMVQATDPKYQAQEAEAIRVLKSLPVFIPAKFYEKPSSSTFILPLEFKKRKLQSVDWHLDQLFRRQSGK